MVLKVLLMVPFNCDTIFVCIIFFLYLLFLHSMLKFYIVHFQRFIYEYIYMDCEDTTLNFRVFNLFTRNVN